jgi:hypothetical protein
MCPPSTVTVTINSSFSIRATFRFRYVISAPRPNTTCRSRGTSGDVISVGSTPSCGMRSRRVSFVFDLLRRVARRPLCLRRIGTVHRNFVIDRPQWSVWLGCGLHLFLCKRRSACGASDARKYHGEDRESLHVDSNLFASRLHFTNLNTVVLLKSMPGFNTEDGNFGLLGESGKCCVSRQRAERRASTLPPFPLMVPSRKLPV